MHKKYFANLCFTLSLIWLLAIALHELALFLSALRSAPLWAVARLPLPRLKIGEFPWPLVVGFTLAFLGYFLRNLALKNNKREGDV